MGAGVEAIPVGYIRATLPAGQTVAVTNPFQDNSSLMGGQLRGSITAIGSNYFENSDANWIPGQLSQLAIPFMIRITSGGGAGHIFSLSASVANTATRVATVLGPGATNGVGISVGDKYEIIPADTYSNLFPAGILQSGNSSTADLVRYWNGVTWINYYHDGTNWRRQGGGISDNTTIFPHRGMMITRRGATKPLYFTGTLPPVKPVAIANAPGEAFISVVSAPKTLAEASIQNVFPNWQTDLSVSPRDRVNIWDGTTFQQYEYDGANARWVTPTGINSDNVPFYAIDRPFVLTRVNGPTQFFTVPSPYLSN